jgi:iron(III) transport system ATP-binding protein
MQAEGRMLELLDVTKRFRNTTAVDRVSVGIEKGGLLVLLGPSGCGKTTTIRLIAGLLTPDEGRILSDGGEIASPRIMIPAEKRHFSMVFQSYAVWPHMTVFGNVAYGLKLRKFSKKKIQEKVESILDVVKLSSFKERYPWQMSGGEQQRISLARALVVEPKVLLMDEPLSNLDASLRMQMRLEIRELQKRLGITAVYVTHDQTEAMVLGDKIAVMNKGRIEQVGSAKEIYLRSKNRFVASFIGSTNLFEGSLRAHSATDELYEIGVPFGSIKSSDSRLGKMSVQRPNVAVAFRPEDVEVVIDGPVQQSINVFEATVISTAYMGSLIDVQCDVKGQVIKAFAHYSLAVKEGDKVTLCIPPEVCQVLED